MCNGVLECWSIGILIISDFSNNPLLQYSNIPKSKNATNKINIDYFG